VCRCICQRPRGRGPCLLCWGAASESQRQPSHYRQHPQTTHNKAPATFAQTIPRHPPGLKLLVPATVNLAPARAIRQGGTGEAGRVMAVMAWGLGTMVVTPGYINEATGVANLRPHPLHDLAGHRTEAWRSCRSATTPPVATTMRYCIPCDSRDTCDSWGWSQFIKLRSVACVATVAGGRLQ